MDHGRRLPEKNAQGRTRESPDTPPVRGCVPCPGRTGNNRRPGAAGKRCPPLWNYDGSSYTTIHQRNEHAQRRQGAGRTGRTENDLPGAHSKPPRTAQAAQRAFSDEGTGCRQFPRTARARRCMARSRADLERYAFKAGEGSGSKRLGSIPSTSPYASTQRSTSSSFTRLLQTGRATARRWTAHAQ